MLRPLKLNIKKGGIKKRKISIPDFPDTPEKGTHEIAFSDVIYIERDDFMEVGDKGYRRLTKDQHVGLRYANYVVKLLNVVKKDSQGEPLEIDVEAVSVDQVGIFNIYCYMLIYKYLGKEKNKVFKWKIKIFKKEFNVRSIENILQICT